jgi:hypothetical protein
LLQYLHDYIKQNNFYLPQTVIPQGNTEYFVYCTADDYWTVAGTFTGRHHWGVENPGEARRAVAVYFRLHYQPWINYYHQQLENCICPQISYELAQEFTFLRTIYSYRLQEKGEQVIDESILHSHELSALQHRYAKILEKLRPETELKPQCIYPVSVLAFETWKCEQRNART